MINCSVKVVGFPRSMLQCFLSQLIANHYGDIDGDPSSDNFGLYHKVILSTFKVTFINYADLYCIPYDLKASNHYKGINWPIGKQIDCLDESAKIAIILFYFDLDDPRDVIELFTLALKQISPEFENCAVIVVGDHSNGFAKFQNRFNELQTNIDYFDNASFVEVNSMARIGFDELEEKIGCILCKVYSITLFS